jgi:hypothetical protein
MIRCDWQKHEHISFYIFITDLFFSSLMMQLCYFFSAFAELWKAAVSIFMSLSARDSSAPSRRIFIKFNIWSFFENLSRKFKYQCKVTRTRDTLHEDMKTYLAEFFLEREIFSDKRCRDKTRILCSVTLFSRNLACYEIIWKILVEPDMPQGRI